MGKEKRSERVSNISMMIISALLAIILWVILSLTAFPDMTKTLYDVPIDLSLEGSWADLEGLSIINIDTESVNLSFNGRRAEISKYVNDDIKVRLNLDNVRGSGSYNVPLIVESVHGDTITDIRVAPQSVHIDFDRLATKTLSIEDGTLELDLSAIHAAEGHVIDPSKVEVSPTTLEISGPQDHIEQITSCKLGFEGSLTLSSTQKLNVNQTTLYSNGAVINDEMVQKSTEQFTVSVPVFITRDLPLGISLLSYCGAVDVNTIPYRLSTDSILIQSEDSSIEDLGTRIVGYVDIRSIIPGYVQSFEIPEDSRYTNISGVDEIKANFDLEGYTTKSFTLSSAQIMLLNQPAGYNVYVEQNRIRVTAVGPEEVINSLDSSNFVGQIDLVDYDTPADNRSDQRFLTVSVFAPNYPNVWVTGNTQVLASFNPIESEETEPAETAE